MHDLIIRGGTLVDGTGAPARTADVAVRGGRIVEVGRVASPTRQVIDADGALVTPGFIDVHTHYDGQFLWDDKIDPSFSHGVTTAIAGNCGVGFAPLRQEYRRELVELMEGVEDIPGIVLEDGLDWGWSSFADYLDRLGARRYSMDIASQITHSPLRVAVMGERALRHEQATADDLAAMSRHVTEAMKAGAIGFSGARIEEHRSSKGAQVPGTFAADDEFLALARAMGQGGHGTFQIVPRGAIGGMITEGIGRDARLAEHERIVRIARASGRPVTYLLLEMPADPTDWLMMVAEAEKSRAEGLRLYPQVASRPGGLLIMLEANHPYRFRPSYIEVAHLPTAERAAALRDSGRRARILAETDDEAALARARQPERTFASYIQQRIPEMYSVTLPIDFEPTEDARIGRAAARAGVSPDAWLYDHLTAGDGSNVVADLQLNYVHGNLDAMRQLLDNPLVISGLGDGGAHLSVICDASMTTSQLTFWGRDRKRGPRLPLEKIVAKMTGHNAELYDLKDRGAIAVGMRADLNVIDFDRLGLEIPSIVRDLPGGGPRVLQKSHGYLATMVAGAVTRRNDEDTGARPGRLVRSGQESSSSALETVDALS
jgi:N-acyl-D-aspartate/D-glutamate deacylase